MSTIGDRWAEIRREVISMCQEHDLQEPVVIAVSKTRSESEVAQAIKEGIVNFGENNPLEFRKKSEAFPNVNWHFIGHLQRNNVRDVIPSVYCLHTIDRKKLVNKLQSFEFNKDSFLQVNISGEDTKSGIPYNKAVVQDLIHYCRSHGIGIIGLMTIGNPSWDKITTIKEYKEFVAFGLSLGLNYFSLGMSGDWREALLAGATHLRIGTAIFGPRSQI